MRDQPHQQSRKEILQRKSFTPNYGSNSQPFTQMNNIECYECHNLGHVAARCRRRMVQDHHTERSSHSRYFYGYCFACNMFGHKDVDWYRRDMKHVRCYACNKLDIEQRNAGTKYRDLIKRRNHHHAWRYGRRRKFNQKDVAQHNILRHNTAQT